MSILIAILVFGVIIAIHELGHFLVAKAFNVRVNQFSLGMGPAILKKQAGETLYALRILPIGGFVSMEGEDESSDDERAFNKKPVLQRIAIVSAGAIMNLILGFIVVLVMTSSSDYILSTTIGGFSENASSKATGLEVGDKIVSMNGTRVFIDSDIVYQLQTDSDGIIDMIVKRDGEKVNLDKVKFTINNSSEGQNGLIVDFSVNRVNKNVLSVVEYSAGKTVFIGRLIWMTLGDLVTGKYKINDLSGPVGIVSAIDTVISPEVKVDFSQILDQLMGLVTFITINVGMFNLLPIPALDGGRIVFLVIEAIRRKPIKPEHEGIVHFIGLALMLALMVVVAFNDISKLVSK